MAGLAANPSPSFPIPGEGGIGEVGWSSTDLTNGTLSSSGGTLFLVWPLDPGAGVRLPLGPGTGYGNVQASHN